MLDELLSDVKNGLCKNGTFPINVPIETLRNEAKYHGHFHDYELDFADAGFLLEDDEGFVGFKNFEQIYLMSLQDIRDLLDGKPVSIPELQEPQAA